MSQWYGSLDNRLEEGRNYNKDKLIHVGDDITMYLYSDRHPYYVTKVIDQKHIFVHKYSVCADQSKPKGMGHQDWLYFKTENEETKYINDCIDKGLLKSEKRDINSVKESSDEEWVLRYGKWRQVTRQNKELWNKCVERAKQDLVNPNDEEKVRNLACHYIGLRNLSDLDKILNGEEIVIYHELSGKVSFGVRDYYYDWEF